MSSLFFVDQPTRNRCFGIKWKCGPEHLDLSFSLPLIKQRVRKLPPVRLLILDNFAGNFWNWLRESMKYFWLPGQVWFTRKHKQRNEILWHCCANFGFATKVFILPDTKWYSSTQGTRRFEMCTCFDGATLWQSTWKTLTWYVAIANRTYVTNESTYGLFIRTGFSDLFSGECSSVSCQCSLLYVFSLFCQRHATLEMCRGQINALIISCLFPTSFLFRTSVFPQATMCLQGGAWRW